MKLSLPAWLMRVQKHGVEQQLLLQCDEEQSLLRVCRDAAQEHEEQSSSFESLHDLQGRDAASRLHVHPFCLHSLQMHLPDVCLFLLVHDAPPDHFVINVGDMLQRLTNNRLKSTTHRVVNPPREKWNTSRYSIPFFLHPTSEMDLTCLSSCITDESPIAYEPISAGDYLHERLVEIGLIKK